MKTIIVTGAAGGIGSEIVKLLSRQSYTTIATDLDIKALEKLKSLENVIIEKLDVSDGKQWNALLEKYKGNLYGLINSVGVLKPGYIYDVTAEDINLHIDINVKGVMLGSSLVSRILKTKKSGHIINIASMAGIAAIPGIALYSASKFAVRGFTLALAAEMKPFSVLVTSVCPDAVKTPMLDLQADYEEAALTFSGDEPLSAETVAKEIVANLGKENLELVFPTWRGMLAKLSSAMPDLSSMLVERLTEQGLHNQQKYSK